MLKLTKIDDFICNDERSLTLLLDTLQLYYWKISHVFPLCFCDFGTEIFPGWKIPTMPRLPGLAIMWLGTPGKDSKHWCIPIGCWLCLGHGEAKVLRYLNHFDERLKILGEKQI